ncbi:MAG: hypothetical protein WA005_01490 [Candidatus Binataceae bacterium]
MLDYLLEGRRARQKPGARLIDLVREQAFGLAPVFNARGFVPPLAFNLIFDLPVARARALEDITCSALEPQSVQFLKVVLHPARPNSGREHILFASRDRVMKLSDRWVGASCGLQLGSRPALVLDDVRAVGRFLVCHRNYLT